MAQSYSSPTAPEGESLAEYVKKARESLGLSKSELARRALVHISTVHRLESGEVSGQKVKRDVQNRLVAALKSPSGLLEGRCQW